MKIKHLSCLLLILCCFGFTKESEVLRGTGVHISPSKNWKVRLQIEDPQLKITRVSAKPDKTVESDITVIPKGWKNPSETFVFFDQNDVVWVFDRNSAVIIAEETSPGQITLWGLETWTNDMPKSITHLITQ